MGNVISFFKILIKKTNENELLLTSYALTYKLLLALFPLIIVIMNIVGFLNIDTSEYSKQLVEVFPDTVVNIISGFLDDITRTKTVTLLSAGLFITIISASSGFNSVIIGLNKAYGIRDSRNYLKRRGISAVLVLIFAVLIVATLILIIFGDKIKLVLEKYINIRFLGYVFNSQATNILMLALIFIMILIIYKVSIAKKLKLTNILPGSITTVVIWSVASKVFNVYINSYSKYSTVYGTIGSVFILVLWINILAFILLLGGQINAILENKQDYLRLNVEKKDKM